MTRMDRTRSTSIALASAAALTTLASFAPSTTSAATYDMDCKLILCMPAGFPSGCSDAFDHMIDRLRDGKSPIGFCAMSNGDEYERYDIDYRMKAPITPEGWTCPAGKTLYHKVYSGDDGFWDKTVNTFCYDTAYKQTGWTPEGYSTVTVYTNKTPPERKDFWVNLTLEPETSQPISQGWQKFDTGRASRYRVRYSE